MKTKIKSIAAATIALCVSIPALVVQATTVDFLNPNQVMTKSIQNTSYYEFSPIKPLKPSQKWGVHLTLASPPDGVEAIIYTLKGGTFANGKTKIVVNRSEKTNVISDRSHVYLSLTNEIPLPYIAKMIENNAIEQGKITYVYPWHHGLFLGDKTDEKKLLNDLMHYDTPSLVYLYYAAVKATGGDTVFTFKYFETAAQLKAVKEKVKSILAQIIKPRMDVYQKEFAIHNWIASHVSYDFTKAGRNEQDYSAVFAHKADCSGVTELTYQMLTAEGITNRMVPGSLHNGSAYILRGKYYKGATVVGASAAHIWNEVKLNGKWYMLDVTNDLKNINGGHVGYNFYNLTSAQLSNTSTWNHAGLPIADTNFVTVLEHSKNPQDKQILRAIEG